MGVHCEIAIIGSGPAGLSAGSRAAALGRDHVVFERETRYAETIHRYQRGKFVMATPDILPLRSAMSFAAGSREEVLGTWEREIKESGLQIEYGAEVTQIRRANGQFTLGLKDGRTIDAVKVVLAIGVQGNLRKLKIPGAESLVQYQLDDPEEYAGEHIVIVGAGDSAIENALALAAQNQVTIVNRRGEFARAKTGNLKAIDRAIESGKIECVYNATPERVEQGLLLLSTPEGTQECRCDRLIARLGADPPRRFLESCGIEFPKGRESQYPEVSVTYETNVPGLYAIGALAGYPLIKHCMNQGYEVAETVAGREVVPADEPLIEERLSGMPGRPSVPQGLEEIKARALLFRGLTVLQLREFLLDSETHILLPGERIFENGDHGDTLFCVVSGTVEIETADSRDPGGPPRIVDCQEGGFFGEAGLIAGRRRAGTARAKTGCFLIELARRSAIKLLNSDAEARKLFERTTIVRQLQQDVLQDLTEDDLEEVITTAQIERFAKGKVLIKEGDDQDQSVYLIRSGSVTVSRRMDGRDVVLGYHPAGHLVGEMALLRNAPRSATVSAAIATEVIRIDGGVFHRLLDRRPELRAEIERVLQQRVSSQPERESDQQYSGITDFLVSQGLGEAVDVLLIDESLCIRCDNCEKACAESHDGISRLDREAGPTFAMIHVPTSCRHCEHPHCMADCPPDAIHRAANGEVWIDDTCIGCENCANNCPYGVIQMASAPPEKPGLLQWLLLGRGPGPGGYRKYHAPADGPGKGTGPSQKVAVKCDMCKGIDGGAACVRACPTGAAIRVSPTAFLEALSKPQ